MEYHRTKDILYVKQLLGHKRIENTLIYVQLAEELFKDQQTLQEEKILKPPRTITLRKPPVLFNIVVRGVGFEPSPKWRYHPQLPLFSAHFDKNDEEFNRENRLPL
jgi:hypothetical protein